MSPRVSLFLKRPGDADEIEITMGPIPLEVLGGFMLAPLSEHIVGIFRPNCSDPDYALRPGDSLRVVILPP